MSTSKKIKIHSQSKSVYVDEEIEYEQESIDGLQWTMKFEVDFSQNGDKFVYLSWKFGWNPDEFDIFDGSIDVLYQNGLDEQIPVNFHVAVSSQTEWIKKRIGTLPMCKNSGEYRHFTVDFEMTGRKFNAKEIEKNFLYSPFNDTILAVEGREMHVNQVLLAYHSPIFTKIFFSDLKEHSELALNDLKFDDFSMFLSLISAYPGVISDNNAEMLLEFAEQFEMSSVARQVEHYLCFNSNFTIFPTYENASKLLRLAARFDLPRVTSEVERRLLNSDLGFCFTLALASDYRLESVARELIGMIKSTELMKFIKSHENYQFLSDTIKVAIYEQQQQNKDYKVDPFFKCECTADHGISRWCTVLSQSLSHILAGECDRVIYVHFCTTQ